MYHVMNLYSGYSIWKFSLKRGHHTFQLDNLLHRTNLISCGTLRKFIGSCTTNLPPQKGGKLGFGKQNF